MLRTQRGKKESWKDCTLKPTFQRDFKLEQKNVAWNVNKYNQTARIHPRLVGRRTPGAALVLITRNVNGSDS